MKREYNTPFAYVELFTPNQYAGNCQPGISEKDLTPTVVDCLWHNKSGQRTLYNFSNGCRLVSSQMINGCSEQGNTLSLLTNLCQVDFSGGSTYGEGVTVYYGNPVAGYKGPVYSWPNGKGGTHQAKATDVMPGQKVDEQGRPYYFNS
ncbi:MAG: hypothetical protein Q4E53_14700 [Eubacteriales bacterium]|nr:hypothetical protein [Eubacteriales bacterium]